MIRLIVAVDNMRGIAKHGFQPWHIPDDVAYFNEHTKSYGGDVLLGSTTYKTLNEPLAGRQNYVLTHNKEPIEGAQVVNDLEKFLKDFQGKDLWIAGGANVFSQVIAASNADELYITHIEADFGCDQFFPEFEPGFVLMEQSDQHEQNGFIFRYAIYKKR
jgi:dihydrofolate reductase